MADKIDFKELADTHLATYMHEAKKQGIDPEKSVLGMLLAITVQLEHKHGHGNAQKLLTDFAMSL